MVNNLEVAETLEKIADLLQIKEDNPFKIRAYRKAAQSIYRLDTDLYDLYRENCLTEIPGVGKAVRAIIEEILEKGSCDLYESLLEELPPGVFDMLSIPGIGHKTVKTIYEGLGIDHLDDLYKAAKGRKLRQLPGLGAKTENNIIKGIEMYKRNGGRVTLGLALPLAQELRDFILCSEEVVNASIVGSVRRGKPLVGDIDILVACNRFEEVLDLVESYPGIAYITGREVDVLRGYLPFNIEFEVILVPPEEFYHSLVWTTGAKAHRDIIFKGRDRSSLTGIQSEEEIYASLGMSYIPPEIRENRGEIEKALNHELPELVEGSDIQGDLHVHSNWSDGADKIEDMVNHAAELGYSYLAITDHSKNLAISRGLDEQRLSAQGRVIEALNRGRDDFKILKGIEVDILKDGRLDFDDRVLAELDVVVASIHSNFKLDREKQTQRIIEAIKNEHVDIIGHLTGRLLNRREAYQIDVEKILEYAAEYNTVLEINAHPDRLDIDEETARKAREYGVKIAINSDAHHNKDLRLMQYGILNARRGWLTAADVINTWKWQDIESYFKI